MQQTLKVMPSGVIQLLLKYLVKTKQNNKKKSPLRVTTLNVVNGFCVSCLKAWQVHIFVPALGFLKKNHYVALHLGQMKIYKLTFWEGRQDNLAKKMPTSLYEVSDP